MSWTVCTSRTEQEERGGLSERLADAQILKWHAATSWDVLDDAANVQRVGDGMGMMDASSEHSEYLIDVSARR